MTAELDQLLPQPRPAFHFLDLPKELRLVVYEKFFPASHRHDKIEVPFGRQSATITLVTPLPRPSLPPVTRTCRLVCLEATAFFNQRFNLDEQERTKPRLVLSKRYAARLVKYNGALDEMLKGLQFAYTDLLKSWQYSRFEVQAADILDDMRDRGVTLCMDPTTFSAFADVVVKFATTGTQQARAYAEQYQDTSKFRVGYGREEW
jgi:hypothetical protein